MKKITYLFLILSCSVFSQITITNIHPYQVFQRNDTGNADILIEGTYIGNPSNIEARWNNNDVWTTLNINDSETYSGVLVNQYQGQGILEVRFSNDPPVQDSIRNVGVGDIFIIAGQSNASGRGDTFNNYTHPSLKAGLFGNDDVWKELADKVDENSGQVDAVSSDGNAKGTPWPLITTNIMEIQNVPIAFVPTAKGGTRIFQWEPGEDHSDPSTLYGSMYRRIQAIGGKAKGILFFQGESDAQFNTTQEDYENLMNIFVDTVASDFPELTVMIGQIGQANFDGLDDVRAAQINVIQSNSNASMGPATYDMNLADEEGDTLHFKSDADIQEFARRWLLAINRIYYSGTNGYGPIVDTANVIYNTTSNKILIPFTDEILPVINPASTVTTDSFDIYNNGPVSLSSITIIDNTIELIPSTSLDIDQPITITYASSNKGVDAAIYDDENLPAQNFYNIPASIRTLSTSDFDKNDFLVYPNPVDEELSISFNTTSIKNVKVEMYSSVGQLISSTTSEVSDALLKINTSKFSSGMYYVYIITEDSQTIQKILKM